VLHYNGLVTSNALFSLKILHFSHDKRYGKSVETLVAFIRFYTFRTVHRCALFAYFYVLFVKTKSLVKASVVHSLASLGCCYRTLYRIAQDFFIYMCLILLYCCFYKSYYIFCFINIVKVIITKTYSYYRSQLIFESQT
jgi:hypothetical protein